MSRIDIPTVELAPPKSKPLLEAVRKQLGIVPNLMRLVGRSPAALEGYLALNDALATGVIDSKLRERLALAVAQFNHCEYCLSAHTYLARNVAKLDESEIRAAREGRSGDPKANAALQFARRVASEHGRISDVDLSTLRAAGFNDAAIIEIVLNVALNVLTNYINNVALTDVDFPAVDLKVAA